jgi:hypothetical protein
MGDAGTKFTYRITADGVDAVKAAFGELGRVIAGAAGIGGLGFMIENSLKTATGIEEMARQAGMGTQAFQEWSYVLQKFGVDQGKASEEMAKFNVAAAQFVTQNAGPGKAAFEKLFGAGPEGQKAVQQGMQNVGEFFGTVLAKIGALSSESEKLLYLKDIFGKGAYDLIGPADAGLAAMQAFREEAERVGVVMSEDVIKSAHEAENRINTLTDILHMKLAIAIDENADKLAHLAQVGIDMLPALIKLIDDVASGLEDTVGYMKQIADGDFSGFISHLSEGLTAAMQATVLPGAVNPTGHSTGYLAQNPYPQEGFTDLSRMAFSHQSQAMSGDFYSLMGLKAPPQAKAPAASPYGLTIGDPAADAQRASNEKLIETLKQEADALALSERQMQIVTAQRRLSANATQAQKDAVAEYVGEIYDEHQALQDKKYLESMEKELQLMGLTDRERAIRLAQQGLTKTADEGEIARAGKMAAAIYDEGKATEELKKQADELKQSFKEVGDDVSQAFFDMSMGGKKFGDVLTTLLKQIEEIAYKKLVGDPLSSFVSSTLDGLIGGTSYDAADTSFMSNFGGGMAGGGDVDAGTLYRVNENNREYFRPSSGGTIIPLGGGGDGGVSIQVYNNSPAQVTPQVSRGGDGTRNIVLMIDQAVAGLLQNPFSETAAALQSQSSSPAVRY